MNRKAWTAKKIAQIKSGQPIPEADIRAMRTIIRNDMNRNDAPDHSLIMELIEEYRPAVTDEQARKGAEWLHRSVFTSRGQVRKTAFAEQFTAHDLAVIRECLAAPRFNLIELEICENGRYIAAVFPVYRCHGAGGKSFDYSARAWQSGGNSYVTGRNHGN